MKGQNNERPTNEVPFVGTTINSLTNEEIRTWYNYLSLIQLLHMDMCLLSVIGIVRNYKLIQGEIRICYVVGKVLPITNSRVRLYIS